MVPSRTNGATFDQFRIRSRTTFINLCSRSGFGRRTNRSPSRTSGLDECALSGHFLTLSNRSGSYGRRGDVGAVPASVSTTSVLAASARLPRYPSRREAYHISSPPSHEGNKRSAKLRLGRNVVGVSLELSSPPSSRHSPVLLLYTSHFSPSFFGLSSFFFIRADGQR